jgi:PIN domain nuclease of toxin-antitoxin system
VAISAMTLIEIAILFGEGSTRSDADAADLLNELEASPTLHILPMTVPIAAEIAGMGAYLRDLGDRAIVATARVHGLRLVTSDQRIIESNLVPTVE